MTYLNEETEAPQKAKLEISNKDGNIVFTVWPAHDGDPTVFVAKSEMDLLIVKTAVDCSNYVRPGTKKK